MIFTLLNEMYNIITFLMFFIAILTVSFFVCLRYCRPCLFQCSALWSYDLMGYLGKFCALAGRFGTLLFVALQMII